MGIVLWLWFVMRDKSACYTLWYVGTDGCLVCYTTQEYAAGDNGQKLYGAIVCITDVFTPESKKCSVRNLYHQHGGYAYAIILNLPSAVIHY